MLSMAVFKKSKMCQTNPILRPEFKTIKPELLIKTIKTEITLGFILVPEVQF